MAKKKNPTPESSAAEGGGSQQTPSVLNHPENENTLPTPKRDSSGRFVRTSGRGHPKGKVKVVVRQKVQLLDPDSEESWLQLKGEGPKPYEAFCAYRDLPRGERTITAAAKKLHKHPQLLFLWSRQWQWKERVIMHDRQQDRLRMAKEADAIAAMNVRQAQLGISLQSKAVAGLKKLKAEKMTAHEISRAAKDGAHIERNARGVAAEVSDVRVSGEIEHRHSADLNRGPRKLDMSRLSDEQFAKLQELISLATVAEEADDDEDGFSLDDGDFIDVDAKEV